MKKLITHIWTNLDRFSPTYFFAIFTPKEWEEKKHFYKLEDDEVQVIDITEEKALEIEKSHGVNFGTGMCYKYLYENSKKIINDKISV